MTSLRPLILVLAWCGCSSSPAQPAADMTTAPADLAIACTYSVTGDVTLSGGGCTTSLCHPTSNDYESISIVIPTAGHLLFQVDGTFATRAYASAEFRAFDADISTSNKDYQANNQLAGSALSATVTALTAPTTMPCDGIAHATATATLVEYDQSTNTPGSGRATLTVSF